MQTLGWRLAEHWRPDARVTIEGFHMLFEMLWRQRDDERIHVLLSYAKQQRELHQTESFALETEEYRQWMSQATRRGCRGLFRTLRRDEMPYLRPFQDRPRAERMPHHSVYNVATSAIGLSMTLDLAALQSARHPIGWVSWPVPRSVAVVLSNPSWLHRAGLSKSQTQLRPTQVL